MKIIIFGGNGFIGSHLVNNLEHKKNKIKIFGNKSYSKKGSNLIYYNKKNFKNILRKISPDVIIFLSGNSYPNNTLKDETYDFRSNNIVLQEFLEVLTETNFKKSFFYTSSIAVYGSVVKKNFVEENHKLNPESYYGLSKLIAEKQIEYFSNKYNLNSTVLRLSSVYGPGLKRQIVYKIIKETLNSKSIKLLGNASDRRQLLYVKDCARMIIKIIKKKPKGFNLFNLSSGRKIKILDILKISDTILKKKTKHKFLNRIKAPLLPALSNKKFLDKIGYIKFTDIKFGIKETIDWLKSRD